MGPNTSRAITRMMSSSQIMGLRNGYEAREFLDPALDNREQTIIGASDATKTRVSSWALKGFQHLLVLPQGSWTVV